uniref:Uncharacterized protein n=1 Tax=Arundo donax TaxID=35708 RepID=A0A0A9BNV7_ARUDO
MTYLIKPRLVHDKYPVPIKLEYSVNCYNNDGL